MPRRAMTAEEKAERKLAETKETIRRARVYLSNPVRWAKGTLVRKEATDVSRCILGAIRGQKKAKYKTEAERLIAKRLHEDGLGYSIPGFNDARSTTHEDVIGLLDRTLNDTILLPPPEKLAEGRSS